MLTALQAPENSLDTQEENFVAKIREFGWFCTHVSAEGDEPGFSYTTGFWVSLGAPEIIVFGLQAKTAHDIFWDMFTDLKAGKTLPVCCRSGDLLGNHDAYLFPVQKAHYAEYLGWNRWFYGGENFPCVQLVWPDRDNVFPWKEAFDATMVTRQVDISERGWSDMSRES